MRRTSIGSSTFGRASTAVLGHAGRLHPWRSRRRSETVLGNGDTNERSGGICRPTRCVAPAAKSPIYLDYQATTPTDPRVVDAMLPYFTEMFGNPHSRHHRYGRDAEEAVEKARAQVAHIIGANEKEIIFTSGATEFEQSGDQGSGALLPRQEATHHHLRHRAQVRPRQLPPPGARGIRGDLSAGAARTA